ncbi:MAG TPA: tetratricopeptide repeat protein [Pyrinomonadaceae bacterium]|nr:tetratricopeptide repeat protein [Pyrinomonadaceae bacterium]
MLKLFSRLRLQPVHYVFAAVLLVRLFVLGRLAGSAFLLPTRGDMHFYDDWAQKVVGGQLTDHHAFYGLPGYAYLLAGLYKLCGYGPYVPELLQALLDAGTALLLYKISLALAPQPNGRRGQIAGLMVAAAWAFCVPAQTYAAVLMPTAWFIFVFWFILWRIIKSQSAPDWWEALLLGLLVGLTATAIATILFLIPLLVCAIGLKPAIPARSHFRIVGCALVLLGIAIGTSPCWLHNYFIARDRVFLSAHSGINFWIGNNPDANGYPRFPPGLRAGQAAMLQDSIDVAESVAGHPLKRGEVSQYWSAKARDYIADHPLAWLRLLGLKLRNFWSAFQYDDLSIITNMREQGVTFPGIYFGLLAALALPAMILTWNTARLGRWITGAIFLQMLALLPVFTTERYRLPIVPGLAVFAAFGLVTLFSNLAAGNVRPVLSYAMLLMVSTLFVSWPQRGPSLWALDAYNSGWQALESRNLSLAERKLELARAYVPDNAETNFALGNLKLAQNDTSAASSLYLTTLRLDPRHRGAINNLGVLALENGQSEVAEQRFREALAIDGRNPKTHFLLAKTLIAKGQNGNARAEIDRALALKPDQPEFKELREQIEK